MVRYLTQNKKHMLDRHLAFILALATTSCLLPSANAQTYPTKPVRYIVPFPAITSAISNHSPVSGPRRTCWSCIPLFPRGP
jgi:hypothetical protein